MIISRQIVREVVEARYKHHSSNEIYFGKTERDIEELVAMVQSVLDVTEAMPGWSAAEIHSMAASACQRKIYDDAKR